MNIHRTAARGEIKHLISGVVAIIAVSTFDGSAALAGEAASAAQSNDLAQLPSNAPVGHHQPRLENLQQQEQLSVSEEQKRLDRLLTICRGC